MSNRPMTRSCSRENNRHKLPDLNAPLTEESAGSTALPVNQQQGLQAAVGDGCISSPIDVEEIEDEVEVLYEFQARNWRRHAAALTLFLDTEARAAAGLGVEKLYGWLRTRTTIFCTEGIEAPFISHHFPTRGVNVDTEPDPVYSDQSSTKRCETMIPFKEPAVPQEPLTFTCPVCISELVEPCSTSCGHIFCEGCIKLSIQMTKKCPTCRKVLRTIKSYHRVYLPTTN